MLGLQTSKLFEGASRLLAENNVDLAMAEPLPLTHRRHHHIIKPEFQKPDPELEETLSRLMADPSDQAIIDQLQNHDELSADEQNKYLELINNRKVLIEKLNAKIESVEGPDQASLERLRNEFIEELREYKEFLLNHNWRLVVSALKPLMRCNQHVSQMDYVQRGGQAYLNAIDKYDLACQGQTKFSTYAYTAVKRAAKDLQCANQDNLTKTCSVRKLKFQYDHARQIYRDKHGSDPKLGEFAKELGVHPRAIKKLLKVINKINQDSLDRHVDGDEDSYELYGLLSEETSDDETESLYDKSQLKNLIIDADLTDREYEMLALRHGLGITVEDIEYPYGEELSAADTGAIYNITDKGASSIYNGAMRKLDKARRIAQGELVYPNSPTGLRDFLFGIYSKDKDDVDKTQFARYCLELFEKLQTVKVMNGIEGKKKGIDLLSETQSNKLSVFFDLSKSGLTKEEKCREFSAPASSVLSNLVKPINRIYEFLDGIETVEELEHRIENHNISSAEVAAKKQRVTYSELAKALDSYIADNK